MGTYISPKNKLEKAMLDLEKLKHKDSKRPQQIESLQRIFYQVLIVYEAEGFDPSAFPDLVASEIEQKRIVHAQQTLREYKLMKVLAKDVARMAFDLDQVELTLDACSFVIKVNALWRTPGKNTMLRTC